MAYYGDDARTGLHGRDFGNPPTNFACCHRACLHLIVLISLTPIPGGDFNNQEASGRRYRDFDDRRDLRYARGERFRGQGGQDQDQDRDRDQGPDPGLQGPDPGLVIVPMVVRAIVIRGEEAGGSRMEARGCVQIGTGPSSGPMMQDLTPMSVKRWPNSRLRSVCGLPGTATRESPGDRGRRRQLPRLA
eukprot:757009-Hanusia_phi.AAC.3